MDDHDSLTDPPSTARGAARRALDAFEKIAMAGPMPEPMRSQLIETISIVVDAAVERAVRRAVERVLASTLSMPTEAEGDDEPQPQPLVPDGAALAIDMSIDGEGGLTFGK